MGWKSKIGWHSLTAALAGGSGAALTMALAKSTPDLEAGDWLAASVALAVALIGSVVTIALTTTSREQPIADIEGAMGNLQLVAGRIAATNRDGLSRDEIRLVMREYFLAVAYAIDRLSIEISRTPQNHPRRNMARGLEEELRQMRAIVGSGIDHLHDPATTYASEGNFDHYRTYLGTNLEQRMQRALQ